MKQTKSILANTAIAGTLALQATVSDAQHGALSNDNSDNVIREFKIHFPDAKLADLRQRIIATNWPEKETVNDHTQGVQLATMQKLAHYWAYGYNWRKMEEKLNSLPQFMTKIDGLDIHFIHVHSKHSNALPIIITHGWPGSIIELLKLIDPLTNPTAHGGKPEDAFNVVIPSIPGYGFSQKPDATGWDPQRIAKAWSELMKRLGYNQYVAQGGDWGDLITELMAVQKPEGLLAIHTNLPAAMPAEIGIALHSGGGAPSNLSADEKQAYNQIQFFLSKGLAYAQQMSHRPQTLYGIADSPIGLASWILDHDVRSYELIARSFDGKDEGLTRDDILDNITLYWLTNTAISSARIYWENKNIFFVPLGISIPVAVSAFPDELYQAPRSWVEKAFPNLLYYNRLNKGGHFAAWEQPKIFTEELRASFRSLRK